MIDYVDETCEVCACQPACQAGGALIFQTSENRPNFMWANKTVCYL